MIKKHIIPIMKAEEETYGRRIYTKESIKYAMEEIRGDSSVPVNQTLKDGMKKTVSYLRKLDFMYNENTGLLSIAIDEDTRLRSVGLYVTPGLMVRKSRQNKDNLIVLNFQILEIQISEDLSAFSSIDSKIN